MKDIVEWLRRNGQSVYGPIDPLNEAADEIERLRGLLHSTRNMWAAVSQDAHFAHSRSRGHVCDYVRSLQSCKDRALEEVKRIDAALAGTADQPPVAQGLNVGHGHVFPRPDGLKARCGGPGLCVECSHDLAHKNGTEVILRATDNQSV